MFVVGNVVSRGNPLMEAILDRGLRYISGPQWLYENVLRDKWVLAVAGTHGKTTTTAMLAWILEHAGSRARIPDRRRAVDFRRFRAPDRQRLLRDRGRRIRHGVLRQALEVRPLPAAHRGPQQSRIRSRRHLPRPGRDRDAVPPSRAHRFRPRAGSSSTAAKRASQRVLARGCWSEVERFGLAEVAGTGPDWTIGVDGPFCWEARRKGTLTFGEAGRHSQLNALAALAAARHAGVPVPHGLAALAEFRGVKRRLELRGGRTAGHASTTTSRIIRPPSRRRWMDCAARRAGRAFSPCSSRARTR